MFWFSAFSAVPWIWLYKHLHMVPRVQAAHLRPFAAAEVARMEKTWGTGEDIAQNGRNSYLGFWGVLTFYQDISEPSPRVSISKKQETPETHLHFLILRVSGNLGSRPIESLKR
jgi:hypothetical protein